MTEHQPPGVPTPTDATAVRTGTLAGHSLELLIAQVASNTGYFAAVLIIARALGPSGRGTIAFVTVAALIVARTATLGIADASAVFAAKKPPDQRPTVLATVVMVSAIGSLTGAALLALAIATLTPAGEPAGVDNLLLAAIVAGALATAVMDSTLAFLLGCRRFRHYAAGTALAAWAYAITLVVVVLAGDLDVHSAALSWVAAHLLSALAGLAYAVATFSIRWPPLHVLRECLAFGLRASLGTFSRFLSFRADQLIMGFLTTEAVLGVYAVAVNASEILLYVPWAAAMAFLPLSASGRLSTKEQVLATFRILLSATLASVAVSVLVGPFLLPIVFGEDFRASVVPFLILVPGPIGYAAIWLFSNALLASSRPGRASAGPFSSLVLGLGLAVALIPIWGAEGAAAAATIGYVAGGLVAAAMYRRTSPVGLLDFVPRWGDAMVLITLVRTRFRTIMQAPRA